MSRTGSEFPAVAGGEAVLEQGVPERAVSERDVLNPQPPGHDEADGFPASTDRTRNRARKRAWILAFLMPVALLPLAHVGFISGPGGDPLRFRAILVLVLVASAAATDLLWSKIPNWLTYPAFAWALALPILGGGSSTDGFDVTPLVTDSLTYPVVFQGAGVALVLMMVIFLLAGGGGGDLKLAIVLGALLGPWDLLLVLVWTYVLAGGAAFAILVWTEGVIAVARMTFWRLAAALTPLSSPEGEREKRFLARRLRMGPFFLLAALAVVLKIEVVRLW